MWDLQAILVRALYFENWLIKVIYLLWKWWKEGVRIIMPINCVCMDFGCYVKCCLDILLALCFIVPIITAKKTCYIIWANNGALKYFRLLMMLF